MITPLAVRFGHACNSSSTHSIVMVGKNDVPKDKLLSYSSTEFGWEWFVLSSDKAKKQYFLAQVIGGAVRGARGDVIQHIVDKLGIEWRVGQDYSVNHQSQWILPSAYGTQETDTGFAEEIFKLVMKDNVVIIGGNDNESEENIPDHALIPGERLSFERKYGSYVCRNSNGIWTLFDKGTGNKTRLTFGDSGQEYIDSKKYIPDTPELVDLKITDYCTHHCSYCYQGSDEKGKHAKTNDVIAILQSLHNMQVFEVAFGGGEQTSHPNFREFLNTPRIYYYGFYPTFTTRNLEFFKDEGIARIVRDGMAAFAYSIDYPRNVVEAIRASYRVGVYKFALNVVENTLYEKSSWEDILTIAGFHGLQVIALGHKESKRKYAKKAYDNSWMLEVYKNNNHAPALGVDSLFAKTHETELRNKIGSRRFYDMLVPDDEGVYSCYIDAVAMTMSKNSYENTKKFTIDAQSVEQSIRDNFKAIQQETIGAQPTKGE